MLLATITHRFLRDKCWIIHAVSPAVPVEATKRVIAFSKQEGWRLKIIETGEFSDEAYLNNPVDRCFYCKRHLYEGLSLIAHTNSCHKTVPYPIVSGTNIDDLMEYRPGLEAARQYGVRHPFIEAGIDKSDIRVLSRSLKLPFAELPASPCLASRLYTGTRVTPKRLLASHFAENMLKRLAGVDVVRCRVQEDEMKVEVLAKDRKRITDEIVHRLRTALWLHHPSVSDVTLDPIAYAPGRAFRMHI